MIVIAAWRHSLHVHEVKEEMLTANMQVICTFGDFFWIDHSNHQRHPSTSKFARAKVLD
jgi:hypothetical protein